MINLAVSSITTTAGSVFLSFRLGVIKRITAPNEKIHIKASYLLKSSLTLAVVESSNQFMVVLLSENFDGANIFH